MRNITAIMVAPILKLTGFRFSKAYRQGYTLRHKIVYKMVNTVTANLIAGL